LNHQPLLKASNPSRRERVSNWVTRQRPVLAGIAGVFGVVTLGILLSRLTNVRPKPSVETLPDFQSAVYHVKQGLRLKDVEERRYQHRRAVHSLLTLVKEYPHSCLINLYLSLSLDSLALSDKDKKKQDAERYLRTAYADRVAEAPRVAWAKDYPELVDYLVDFAYARIKGVDKFAEIYDQDRPNEDEERDLYVKGQPYELAGEALQLAEKLDPISPPIQFLLAKTDEVAFDYASAHKRLTQLIETASSSGIDLNTLFFARELRGRVAFLWADERQREQDSLDEGTLTRLEIAQEDLDKCSRYLGGSTFNTDQELKKYHVIYDQVWLRLTLAEFQIDFKRPTEARHHLEAAHTRFKSLNEQADPYKLKGCDLRLMSLVKDVSGIPTAAKNLIIVAAVDHVFHFRIFDVDGNAVVDTDEKRLTKQARRIEDLRKQLESLWPPHELTKSEKDRVIDAATSIAGCTPLKVPYPTRLEERMTAGWSRLAALDSAGGPNSKISSNQSSKDGLKSGYAIARQESDFRRSYPDGTRLPSAP